MDEHHYLGAGRDVGARLYHVAEEDGEWLALISWAAAAWKVKARDEFLGGRLYNNPEKLRCVVNNTRFLVLPTGRQPHLASRVLGLSCQRLGEDWKTRYGYQILIAETFVDRRFRGTCYLAAGWQRLGMTRGWAKTRQGYILHGEPKAVWVKELVPNAVEYFRAPFTLPFFTHGNTMPTTIELTDELIKKLRMQFAQHVTDPRKPWGKRHEFASLITLMVLGNLCGLPCVAHIAEWAKSLSAKTLRLLGFRAGLAPSHATLHRVSASINVDEFVSAGRALSQDKTGSPYSGKGISIDGKTIRGAKEPGHRAPHVVSATTHDERLILNQETVPEKKNETGALKPLLDPLDIRGAMVTLDALFTNDTTARYIKDEKQADYMLTVKGNQPTLLEDLETLFEEEGFSPSVHRKSH